jgi:hypothetical protein
LAENYQAIGGLIREELCIAYHRFAKTEEISLQLSFLASLPQPTFDGLASPSLWRKKVACETARSTVLQFAGKLPSSRGVATRNSRMATYPYRSATDPPPIENVANMRKEEHQCPGGLEVNQPTRT